MSAGDLPEKRGRSGRPAERIGGGDRGHTEGQWGAVQWTSFRPLRAAPLCCAVLTHSHTFHDAMSASVSSIRSTSSPAP